MKSSSKNHNQSDTLSFDLMPKGLNFDNLYIQRISGKICGNSQKLKHY